MAFRPSSHLNVVSDSIPDNFSWEKPGRNGGVGHAAISLEFLPSSSSSSPGLLPTEEGKGWLEGPSPIWWNWIREHSSPVRTSHPRRRGSENPPPRERGGVPPSSGQWRLHSLLFFFPSILCCATTTSLEQGGRGNRLPASLPAFPSFAPSSSSSSME